MSCQIFENCVISYILMQCSISWKFPIQFLNSGILEIKWEKTKQNKLKQMETLVKTVVLSETHFCENNNK